MQNVAEEGFLQFTFCQAKNTWSSFYFHLNSIKECAFFASNANGGESRYLLVCLRRGRGWLGCAICNLKYCSPFVIAILFCFVILATQVILESIEDWIGKRFYFPASLLRLCFFYFNTAHTHTPKYKAPTAHLCKVGKRFHKNI